MIATTIEQSKKLLELSIDTSTADMFWLVTREPHLHVLGNEPLSNYDRWEHYPAWSLSALIKLMPPYLFEFERGIDLNVYPNLNGKGWHCSYMPNAVENMKNDKFKQITNGDNPIDAAFEMICWLLENKKI